jgi:hypothetical protein
MKIILISGKAGSGKDTTATLMSWALQEAGYRVLTTHFADLLKFVCQNFFGWDGEKDEYGRTLIQYVGTDVIRAQDEDYWVRFLADILKFFPDTWDYVLVPDTRFPNEIGYLRLDRFDVTHIRVVRDHLEGKLTTAQQLHPSETALDHTMPDYTIHNDGSMQDLNQQVLRWVETETIKNKPPMKADWALNL